MVITAAMEGMLKEEIRRGKDVVFLARQYGIPLRLIRELVIKFQHERLNSVPIDRPELEQYVLAKKNICDEWSLSPEILRAREDYDTGLCEICTGRSGDILILYAIPRRTRNLKRKPYFSRKLEE